MNETLKTYASSEAKNLGSESTEVVHLFLAAVKILSSRDLLENASRAIRLADEIRQFETQKEKRGFKTPEFSASSNSVLADLNSVSDLLEFVNNFQLGSESKLSSKSNSEEAFSENIPSPLKAGGFHVVEGPNLSRLPKYMPQKDYAAVIISKFLLNGENYIWDGVYNSKGYPISTRVNTQSMGRLFVTNLRIIFWSDDLDKPHLGVFYSDIDSWKTNWMPMKSRGIAMVVSGNKVLFAANSTAIEFATQEYLRVKR
jgi:hypothetical protein